MNKFSFKFRTEEAEQDNLAETDANTQEQAADKQPHRPKGPGSKRRSKRQRSEASEARAVDARPRQMRRSALLSIVVLLVVLIVLNLIFERFLGPYTTFDWTAHETMTLGETSMELVSDLESPVEITVLMEEDDFPGNYYGQVSFVGGLLDEYERSSNGMLTVRYIDPELTPAVVEELDPQQQHTEELKRGNMAVRGTETNKLKVLNPSSFVDRRFNQQTYQMVTTGYSAEEKISGAINFVAASETPVLYLTVGHQEAALDQGFTVLQNILEYNNFEIAEYDGRTGNAVPEDARALLMLTPQTDITATEAKLYMDYLESGGNLIVLLDYSTTDFHNLNQVLHEFNLKITDNRVRENDPNVRFDDAGYSFLARTKSGKLGNYGDNAYSLVGPSCQITDAQNSKEWIETEAVLTSSDQAVVEYSGDQEDTSAEGEQVIGMLSENKGWMDGDTVTQSSKVLVLGSSLTFSDAVFNTFLNQTANYAITVNTLNYLGEMEADRLMIRSKPVESYAITVENPNAVNVASGVSWLIIPLFFVIIAILVYRRRKNL